jgi:hypothetical protein
MRTAAAIAVLVLLPACTVHRTTETIPGYPVSGDVVASPTCPVESDPPDPNCAPAPVPGAHLEFRRDNEKVGDVVVDQNGHFTVDLPEGDYVVIGLPVDGLIGTPDPTDFTAGPGLAPELTITYDTGIR